MNVLKLYAKTAGLALLSAVLICSPIACSQTSVDDALNKIASQIPVATAAVNVAGAVVGTVDPALVAPIAAALAVVDPGLAELKTLITEYTASPTASVLSRIQTLINDIVTQGSAALYAAAHITDAATQQKITAVLAALVAPLTLIDGFIQSIESSSTLKANAASRTVKLAMIDPYLDHQKMNQLAAANGTSYRAFYLAEQRAGF